MLTDIDAKKLLKNIFKEPELLSVEQVAEALNISEKEVWSLLRSGHLIGKVVYGDVKFSIADVVNYYERKAVV